MADDLISRPRPVYVLGAGFSKAIHENMPITDQLGRQIKERLPTGFDMSGIEAGGFEDWLTLRLSELPFLEGHVNKMRRAEAERVIAEIAGILDDHVAEASATSCPLWLQQLILLWHSERAIVITFNYDTLLEQAINLVRPVINGSPLATTVYADQIVFPAPPGPPAEYMIDTASHNSQSFQILKLHGSLNWYWAVGDPTGSTLVRMREKRVLGSVPLTIDYDFAGAKTLDRYLIPPVTAKDGYYNSYLSHALWRSASDSIRIAPRITLMGYSMPANDRVTVELINQSNATFEIVDLDPGSPEDPRTLAGRIARLGPVDSTTGGATAISDFVSKKLKSTASALSSATVVADSGREGDNVVLAVPSRRGVSFYCLYEDQDEAIQTYQIDPSLARGSSSPLNEIAYNQMPRAKQSVDLGDFFNRRKLRARLESSGPLVINASDGQLVAVSAVEMTVERWKMIRLCAAPLG
ncbi:SIR2 family protein [Cryobacterium sp. PH31-L1]|uniref:SIR2 family protein n=1 Tax=Cryobacterium sp. PH31-L1 TaxID=3046199 RepID=UPI0024B93CBF|nr:SIR2 family protein [Cryobacterium sp. PH31-L1]MDJ0379210.1 SIR2 family protein [Cryobacterium sp. PH31-L1]